MELKNTQNGYPSLEESPALKEKKREINRSGNMIEQISIKKLIFQIKEKSRSETSLNEMKTGTCLVLVFFYEKMHRIP